VGCAARQLEVAEIGQEVTVIAAVAPIGLAELGHGLEVLADHRPCALESSTTAGESLPGVRAPFAALGLDAFIIRNAAGKLLKGRSLRHRGCSIVRASSNPAE
jgi:hypothetical protein